MLRLPPLHRARAPRGARRAPYATFALGAIVLLTGSGGSCSEEQRVPTTPSGPRAAELPAADLRLLVVTDLDGYLEPCGCTSRPLGGIDRLGAKVRALSDGGPPTMFVAAGNLFFHGAPHGADAERAEAQERMRAETVREVLGQIGLAAAAPGPLDFGFGTDRFEAIARGAPFPLLAAGVRLAPRAAAPDVEEPPSPPPLVATTTREIGGRTIGLIGLADLRAPDGRLPDRVSAEDDLIALGREAARELRAAGASPIVALVTADRRTARRIATGIDELDVVVHGGPDEEEVGAPSEVDGAALVGAGRHGRGIVVLDLWLRGGDTWTDASVWTREARAAHLNEQIESLQARIRDWADDDGVNAADLTRQRARLTSLERELRALDAPPEVDGRNVFVARYEELPSEAPRDPAITRAMAEHDRRVNRHNQEAFADWAPAAVDEGQPHYVGSQTCASCHGAAVRWWRETPHGRAYATLEERHKNFNLSCVGCHVTGYLRPGGSTVTHVDRLQDVGCENCHGPASMHVADPTGATVDVQRDAPESLCVRCHNEEHSDRFVYDVYRRLLMAPGHGQPLGGAP